LQHIESDPDRSTGDQPADDSIQSAVDSASNLVVVGPGTYMADVSITTAGLTVVGSGRGTLLERNGDYPITISAADVTIADLRARTIDPNGSSYYPVIKVDAGNPNATIRSASGGGSGGGRFIRCESDDLIAHGIRNTTPVGVNGGSGALVTDIHGDVYFSGTSSSCLADSIYGTVNDNGTGNVIGETI